MHKVDGRVGLGAGSFNLEWFGMVLVSMRSVLKVIVKIQRINTAEAVLYFIRKSLKLQRLKHSTGASQGPSSSELQRASTASAYYP